MIAWSSGIGPLPLLRSKRVRSRRLGLPWAGRRSRSDACQKFRASALANAPNSCWHLLGRVGSAELLVGLVVSSRRVGGPGLRGQTGPPTLRGLLVGRTAGSFLRGVGFVRTPMSTVSTVSTGICFFAVRTVEAICQVPWPQRITTSVYDGRFVRCCPFR